MENQRQHPIQHRENDHDTLVIAKQIRKDLTGLQVRVSELLRVLAALNLEPSARYACPECGLSFRGPRSLAEHAYTSHDGPEPEHWQDAA